MLLAVLYGSSVTGLRTEESDVDIAAAFGDRSQEDRIWREVSALLGKEVDLVSFADAPPTLVSNVFKTGLPLVVRDRKLYWQLYLETTMEAEDFLGFAKGYRDVFLRSASLTPEDKTRLLQRVQFLEEELSEIEKFRKITFEEYQKNRSKRREIERWSENIINAAIDIAKIFLASEKKQMPKTYEEALREFATFAGLSRERAEEFAVCARLRNILAHQYFDILYQKIRDFMGVFPGIYREISEFLRTHISGPVT